MQAMDNRDVYRSDGSRKLRRHARCPFAKNRWSTFKFHPSYAAFVFAALGTGGELNALGNICTHCLCLPKTIP